jgi:glycosyltransferase involved in cell wall biosynthesis
VSIDVWDVTADGTATPVFTHEYDVRGRDVLIHFPVGLYTDLRPPRKLYPREGKIVYDLSMILTPECHPPEAAGMYVLDLAEQIACSDVLFCISEATARDLAWIYGVGPERLRVALLGNNVDLTAAARLRALIAGRPVEPFLLVLGSIEPRKNAVLVLQWLSEHPEVLDEVRIVFAGRQAWGQTFASMIEERGLLGALDAGRIVFTGFVDEAFRTTLLVGGVDLPVRLRGFWTAFAGGDGDRYARAELGIELDARGGG